MPHLNETGLERVLNRLKSYFAKKTDTVFSVNSKLPDKNGNVEINQVEIANNLTSTDSKLVAEEFISRTTGGNVSVHDGNANLAVVRGNMVHTGIVQESITMTVTPVQRAAGVDPIEAEIDKEAFKEYVTESRSITLVYENEDWTSNPLLYGVTVSGDPLPGDKIEITYVMADRGVITAATPASFRSTGWNLYNHSAGYARVLKYSDDYGYMVGGTFVNLQFSETLTGTRSEVEVSSQGLFNVPSDGYVFVSGGTSVDTYILMTHSDWTMGPSGDWQAYTESFVDLSDPMENFPYGLCQVGLYRDEINFNNQICTSVIGRMDYSEENIEILDASGTEYEADRDYIYYVKEEPDTFTFEGESNYTVSDHGMEYFIGTTVDTYAQTLYGENLRDKLRNDVLTISPMDLTEGQKASVRNNIGLDKLAVENGGTGGTTPEEARTNLGVDLLVDKDTDAVSVTWLSGATTYVASSNRTLVFYRRGKIAILRCSINLTTTSTGAAYVDIGTIPEAFKPTTTIYSNAPLRDSTASAGLAIKNDLSVQLRHNNTTAGYLQLLMIYPISSDMW